MLISSQVATKNSQPSSSSRQRAVSRQKTKKQKEKKNPKIGLVGCSSDEQIPRLSLSLHTKIYNPQQSVVRSAGRSVGGGGGAAAVAEVGDAVHALVHRRIGAEAGLDAVLAGRVAPAGHRVQALAQRRDRLGAPAAVVAARPCPRRRLPPAR